jgi:SLOG in TRPM, prokaryote
MQTASPRSIRVSDRDDLPRLLEEAGLSSGPVLVLVGGAGGLGADDEAGMTVLIRDYLVPVVVRAGASVVDGGTNAGIMRAIGSARSDAGAQFQLVGVAATGTVPFPGDAPEDDAEAEVDSNHTHIVLVPGTDWGDESPWLSEVASALSAGYSSATLLVNGGEIAYADVQLSLTAGRPLIVLAGSGRTADAIASAAGNPSADERAQRILASPLVRVVSLGTPDSLAAVLAAALTEATPAG